MGAWGEILFFIFYFSGLHRNWRSVAEIILISANHLYLVNKEYFFIIPMYYEKTNGVCNNQNSLEGATVELKKVNISIIKYPLFSVSLRTLLEKKKKSSIYSVLCDFSFPVKCSLFCINGFYLSDTVHKHYIFFFISQQLP